MLHKVYNIGFLYNFFNPIHGLGLYNRVSNMGKFIIGLIIGVGIAGGLAFYLSNAPTQIVNKASNSGINSGMINGSSPIVLAPGTKLQQASDSLSKNASQGATNIAPQSYDFYNILPGNKTSAVRNKSSDNSLASEESNYAVQAGVFTDQNAANDMKARLALLGIDSQIKSQQQSNKVINWVLIGPFTGEDEADEMVGRLKNENIQGIVIKVGN